jgi:hypothetical protein
MPNTVAELHAKAAGLREQADRQMDPIAAAACRAMAEVYRSMAELAAARGKPAKFRE